MTAPPKIASTVQDANAARGKSDNVTDDHLDRANIIYGRLLSRLLVADMAKDSTEDGIPTSSRQPASTNSTNARCAHPANSKSTAQRRAPEMTRKIPIAKGDCPLFDDHGCREMAFVGPSREARTMEAEAVGSWNSIVCL
jgi:hypothetical protein